MQSPEISSYFGRSFAFENVKNLAKAIVDLVHGWLYVVSHLSGKLIVKEFLRRLQNLRFGQKIILARFWLWLKGFRKH